MVKALFRGAKVVNNLNVRAREAIFFRKALYFLFMTFLYGKSIKDLSFLRDLRHSQKKCQVSPTPSNLLCFKAFGGEAFKKSVTKVSPSVTPKLGETWVKLG